jgi:hypothetical protein
MGSFRSLAAFAVLSVAALLPTAARADEATKPPAAPESSPAPIANEPVVRLPSGPHVRVHIVADGAVTLWRRPSPRSEWTVACESPCDQELPLSDDYRIGSGDAFRIKGKDGDSVELRASRRSWAGTIGGGALVLAGVPFVLVGTFLGIVGAVGRSWCTWRHLWVRRRPSGDDRNWEWDRRRRGWADRGWRFRNRWRSA